MNQGLRVGVLGVGKLGFHHARLLRQLSDVAWVGIHDTDAERLEEVADALDVTPFADRDALLERIDAAVIAVPTSVHEELAHDALERGLHVLIEKPIAASLAAADRIIDAADASGALIQTGHVERFNGVLRACEPHLDEPMFVESHRLAPFVSRGTDVAVVLDLMIHDVDLVLSLIPRPVARIAAVGVPVLTGTADIANARIEFEGGPVANLTASRVSTERKRKIRFFQRSGYMSLDLDGSTGEFLRLKRELLTGAGQGVGFMEPVPEPSEAAPALANVVERVPIESDGAEPLLRELESFIDAVTGRAPVAVSGRAGRRALAIALEINERIHDHVTPSPSA